MKTYSSLCSTLCSDSSVLFHPTQQYDYTDVIINLTVLETFFCRVGNPVLIIKQSIKFKFMEIYSRISPFFNFCHIADCVLIG